MYGQYLTATTRSLELARRYPSAVVSDMFLLYSLFLNRASTQNSQRSLPEIPHPVGRHDSGDTASEIYATVNLDEGTLFCQKHFIKKLIWRRTYSALFHSHCLFFWSSNGKMEKCISKLVKTLTMCGTFTPFQFQRFRNFIF